MKSSLSSFSNAILSRDQMKRVVGGTIYCDCNTYMGMQAGKCSGSSISQCKSYSCGGGGKPTACYYGGNGKKP